jgi:peptidoglycan-associated lipoprotein
MSKTTLFLLLALLGVQPLLAQSWSKLQKEGDVLYSKGQYAEAASKYEQAFIKKPKDKDLAFKAAETYAAIKDYRKAAEYFQYLKDDNIRYPESGLKYARHLKQDGRYEDAKREFQSYLDKYTGNNKVLVQELVRAEIEGCNLARELPARANREAEIKLPGRGINTDANEFAPIAYAQDVLYFSSTAGGKARILRSQKNGAEWSKAGNPESFPLIQNDHYCNGSLSSDGNRFYFTICRGASNWGALSTRCEIFFTIRQGGAWSQPIKLPEHINLSNFTNTQPFVYTLDEREFLIFSSNRLGGRGGMDLWFSSRDAMDDNSEFSFPSNLGSVINTPNDEVTPFYDASNGDLYFSSNGHISIGGFDVFKSRGKEENWGATENIGLPFNSSADDLYYVLSADGYQGFFSSNRTFGGQKTNTRDEDIFAFNTGVRKLLIKGKVFDEDASNALNEVTVFLILVQSDGSEDVMSQVLSPDGLYEFELLPNRSYKITISKEGYDNTSYLFATNDPATSVYGKPVTMAKTIAPPPVTPTPAEESPVVTTTPSKTPPSTKTPATKKPAQKTTTPSPAKPMPAEKSAPDPVVFSDDFYTLTAIGPNDNFEYSSNAPRYQGTYYKVQLIALKKYNPEYPYYRKIVIDDVTMHTELITEKKLTRVLIGDFWERDEAERAHRQIKKLGFPRAFMVKYIDGVRYGIIR